MRKPRTTASTLLGLTTGAAFAFASWGASGASLDAIKAKGAMTVATEDSYKPFEFVQDGQPMGLDHALLALLRKQSAFEIKQQIIPWSGLLAGVASGKYDVALTAAVITPERAKNFAFTTPIAEATQYYVVRADDTRINSVRDLSGRIVGVQSGGASYAALSDLSATLSKSGGKLGTVVQYTSFPEAYQDLLNGRLDYVVNGVVNLTSLTKEHPGRFRMGQAVGAPTYAAWAVAKGNDALLDYLDAFLARTRNDGELYDLQQQWLGIVVKSLPDKPVR